MPTPPEARTSRQAAAIAASVTVDANATFDEAGWDAIAVEAMQGMNS